MGIIEAIQEERIKQATEELIKLVTEQVVPKVQRETVRKLHKRGLAIELISDILEVPLEFAKDAVK